MNFVQPLIVLVLVVCQCSSQTCEPVHQATDGTCQCSNREGPCPLKLPKDWMNSDDANGTCVVAAVLEELKKSSIFGDDYGFMRRLAYVETRDGTEPASNSNDPNCNHRGVGIWGVTNEMLNTMSQNLQHGSYFIGKDELIHKQDNICEYFGVNVTGKVNLRNPLVAGVVARFYLQYRILSTNKSMPQNVNKQSTFWTDFYQNSGNFTERLNGIILIADVCFCKDRKWALLLDEQRSDESAVVDAVVDLMDRSGIFQPDYRFTRRIAYAETNDGRNISYGYGIWGLTNSMLHTMNDRITHPPHPDEFEELQQTAQRICEDFSLNVSDNPEIILNSKDPVVSGVTARYYLQYQNRLTGNNPQTVDEQADFLIDSYNDNPGLNKEYFVKKVIEREGTCHCSANDNEARACPLSLPQDWMNRDNANGPCVVEAVLDTLNRSGIFPPDHRLMRRIAYVETKDGTVNTTPSDQLTRNSDQVRVGIWGLTTNMIQMLMQIKGDPKLENINKQVCSHFGINVMNSVTLNLRNALISGVVARFYLHYLAEVSTVPISVYPPPDANSLPECVDGQADFWKYKYRNKDYFSTHVNFTERVMELEGCKVDADIVFIIDISSTIQLEDINQTICFVRRFVDNLKIGPNDHRVGMVSFGNTSYKGFKLSSYTNKSDLIEGIEQVHNEIYKNRSNGYNEMTDTAKGIKLAREMFESDGRSTNTVMRIAILLSDGLSKDTIHTLNEAGKLHNVTPPVQVYSVGVNAANETEMENISGDKGRYVHINSFNDTETFENIADFFLSDICCYAQRRAPDVTYYYFNGSLDNEEVTRYFEPIPDHGITLKVCTKHGQVGVYVWISVDGEHQQGMSFTCSYSCTDVYIPGRNKTSSRDTQTGRHMRVRRETLPIIQYGFTLEGLSSEIEFSVELFEGDDPSDCVGENTNQNCSVEFVTNQPSLVPTSTPEGSSNRPAVRQTKKKTIVVASTTTSAVFFICCIVTLIVVIGWRVHRRQERRKQKQREDKEEELNLLDNEYIEMDI